MTKLEVAPITAELARHARGFEETEQERQHGQMLERAKQRADPEAEKIFKEQLIAKYKIELFFGPNRTPLGPNAVVMKFWESGRRLHGGGDDLMYMCRDKKTTRQGCGAIFSSDLVQGPYASCPKCKKVSVAGECVRSLVFKDYRPKSDDCRIETRKLAELVALYFRRLDSNCDIYCKFDRTDIRYIAIEQKYGAQRARELRGLAIYPLRHIVKDTEVGAELEKRFFAFLTN